MPDSWTQHTWPDHTGSAEATGGVGDPTWIWTGAEWEQIGNHSNKWISSDEIDLATDRELRGSNADEGPLWTIRTRDGYSLQASPSQRFLARFDDSESWVPLYRLAPGDELAIALGAAPEDAGALPDSSESTDVAYVLGLISGSQRSLSDPLRLTQAEPEIREIVARWADQAQVPYSFDPYQRLIPGSGNWLRRETILYVAGVQDPAKAVVPDLVMSGSQAAKASFLRGLMDRWAIPHRDGCITLSLPNQILRDQIQMLLLLPFGIVAAQRSCTDTPYQLMIRPHDAARLFQLIGLTVQRKRDQLNSWLPELTNAPTEFVPLSWQLISCIDCGGKKPLTLLGPSNTGVYVAQGFVTSETSCGVK